MTDIVQRLNEHAGVRSDGDAKVMIDAAAEIERLSSVCKDKTVLLRAAYTKIEQLERKD